MTADEYVDVLPYGVPTPEDVEFRRALLGVAAHLAAVPVSVLLGVAWAVIAS